MAIDGVSSDAVLRFERYVQLLAAQLYNAAAALMMFERTPADTWLSNPSWPAHGKRREDLIMQVIRTSPPTSGSEFERHRFEAEVQRSASSGPRGWLPHAENVACSGCTRLAWSSNK